MKRIFNKAARRRIAAGLTSLTLLSGAFSLAACRDAANELSTPLPVPVTPTERDILQKPPASARNLTMGETELAADLFDRNLKLSNVMLMFYAEENKQLSSNVLEGDTQFIRIYGDKYLSEDYSREKDPFLYGMFVHEVTRIWQNQTGEKWTKGENLDYLYNLDSRLNFPDYGPLQQGAIMEDYARRFLHDRHSARWVNETYGKNNCEADDFLIRLVEKQFPNAEKIRNQRSGIATRPLNENEASFAFGIFGRQINPLIVRQHFNPIACAGIAATVASKTDINYWSKEYFSNDFTRDNDPFNFGTFIHESTHIWQNQTNHQYTDWQFVNKPDKYAYPIDIKKWSFENYSIEQQAAIIEDYARYFLRPQGQTRRLEMTPEKLSQLQILVESQFPQAKVTREFYQSHHSLPLYNISQP